MCLGVYYVVLLDMVLKSCMPRQASSKGKIRGFMIFSYNILACGTCCVFYTFVKKGVLIYFQLDY